MKKLLCKMGLLFLIVLSYLFFDPIKKFLNIEINTMAITNFLAENLYKDDKSVASIDMAVKDYIIEDNLLYIFPLNQEICLPIDVMIVSVKEDGIEVVNSDTRFSIRHISKRTKNLYQYVHGLNPLGYTDDFFIVEGEDLSMIYLRLKIEYEKV